MLNERDHPLFGKETICHKCSGVAVWVFNGDMVGNYHYCRDDAMQMQDRMDQLLFDFMKPPGETL